MRGTPSRLRRAVLMPALRRWGRPCGVDLESRMPETMPPRIISTAAIRAPRWKAEVEASAAAARTRAASPAGSLFVPGTASGWALASPTVLVAAGLSGAAPRLSSSTVPKWAEMTAPRIAIASRPATRETPLLTPEAIPTRRSRPSRARSRSAAPPSPTGRGRRRGSPAARRRGSRRRCRPAASAAARPRRRSGRRSSAAAGRCRRRGGRSEARGRRAGSRSGSSPGPPPAACSRRPAAGRGRRRRVRRSGPA